MTSEQAKEALAIIIQAERDMQQAKDDYKATVDSAIETYELTPDEANAAKQVAKAMLKDKVGDVEDKATTLLEMVDLVKK